MSSARECGPWVATVASPPPTSTRSPCTTPPTTGPVASTVVVNVVSGGNSASAPSAVSSFWLEAGTSGASSRREATVPRPSTHADAPRSLPAKRGSARRSARRARSGETGIGDSGDSGEGGSVSATGGAPDRAFLREAHASLPRFAVGDGRLGRGDRGRRRWRRPGDRVDGRSSGRRGGSDVDVAGTVTTAALVMDVDSRSGAGADVVRGGGGGTVRWVDGRGAGDQDRCAHRRADEQPGPTRREGGTRSRPAWRARG